MKAKAKLIEDKNEFKPFVLEIEVLDEQTAKGLYNIFNHMAIRHAANINDFSIIRRELEAIVPSFGNPDNFISDVTGFIEFSGYLKRNV